MIATSATAQTFVAQMRITDTISGAYQDFSFSVQLIQCGSTFVWDAGNSAITSVTLLGVGATLEGPVSALANNGNCPLIYTLSVVGLATPPSFITYNTSTNVLSIKPTLPADAGSYTIDLKATVSDGTASPLYDVTSFTL